jgi:cytosine/adenosine deaminase-related metal-dependent hydrolase
MAIGAMRYVSGQILKDNRFEEGYLGFENGIIQDIGKGKKNEAMTKGIILPTFVNAHTHAGDAVIQPRVKGTLEELVAPPNGLKHRVLSETSPEKIVDAMRDYLSMMLKSGTGFFCDFRESGAEGVSQLKEAMENSPLRSMILGRPNSMEYSRLEIDALLTEADGIGLSAVSDWNENEIMKISRHVKEAGKKFALHASEGKREEIDTILDLEPDFLVHMTKATDSDLQLCAENNIPVVICPRTNLFFGTKPPIRRMLEHGLCLALGTDNAMINPPDIIKELEVVYEILRSNGSVNIYDVLRMVMQNPRKVLNAGEHIGPRIGDIAEFLVIETSEKNPIKTLVNGECNQKIGLVSLGEFLWTKKEGLTCQTKR